MATFTYRAVDSRGKRQRGTLSASDAPHARDQLRQQGFRVQSIRQRQAFIAKPLDLKSANGGKTSVAAGRPLRSTRYRSALSNAIRELATLLGAGLPLIEAIDSVTSQARGGFHGTMLAVRDQINSGSSLADAMATEPGVFDEMTVGMIRVGEHAGNLDEVCEQIADFRERSDQMKDRVISAMLYPMIIAAVSLAVTLFLMTVVVPMLLQNLVEIGRPLPWPTLVLKTISDGLLHYGGWMLLFAAGCLVAATLWLRTERGQNWVDHISLRLPVFGSLIQRQALSRMSLVISSLLRSGVELVDALEIAERSATNRPLRRALNQMQKDLRSGQELSQSTSRHPIFTHAVAQVFTLGQQSGQLDRMLQRLGEDYDRQSQQMAGRLTTVVEPILILVLSVVVGFILMATILPILEAGNVLSS